MDIALRSIDLHVGLHVSHSADIQDCEARILAVIAPSSYMSAVLQV